MTPYLFQGLVLPERAQVTLECGLRFTHLVTNVDAEARVSIVLNQIAVWIATETEWDIFDLKNIVKNILQNESALLGYLKGYAFEVELRRVLHPELEIDYVFGIDVPCVANRNENLDLGAKMAELRSKLIGSEGTILARCFNDLVMALKIPDDSAFYCYRAIESLRQHIAMTHKITTESGQWEKLRRMTKVDKNTLMGIKAAADPIRHGGIMSITGDDREKILITTWDIVDRYITSM
jgi:hypothetical protein